MADGKLITNTEIKKAIKGYDRDECVGLILEIAKSCSQAKEFLTLKLAEDNGAILDKYKKIVRNEFYPARGYGRLNLREAKKAISDFKKLSTDKKMVLDLMLFYVECCVEFTKAYGDIDDSFYYSAESVYGQVVKEVINLDMPVYEEFSGRLAGVVDDSSGIGWGFHDCLQEMHSELLAIYEFEDPDECEDPA